MIHLFFILSLLCSLQDQVDAAVKQLLAFKAEFKQITGQEYNPGMIPPDAAPAKNAPTASSSSASGLYESVTKQGDTVRKLKSEKAPKVRWRSVH